MRRTRCQAYLVSNGGGLSVTADLTQGRNKRKPDNTKKIGTPISSRAQINPK